MFPLTFSSESSTVTLGPLRDGRDSFNVFYRYISNGFSISSIYFISYCWCLVCPTVTPTEGLLCLEFYDSTVDGVRFSTLGEFNASSIFYSFSRSIDDFKAPDDELWALEIEVKWTVPDPGSAGVCLFSVTLLDDDMLSVIS